MGIKKFNLVEEALEDLKNGIPIVVVDDEDRENEGDLVLPAEKASYEWINFMINEARGLMCVPLTEERAAELDIDLMTDNNTDSHGTALRIPASACNTRTRAGLPR